MKMPVLFVGHGSPMNAIEENPFTEALRTLGQRLPRPKAIAVVSAHWMTAGTRVLTSANPKTIHDFRGFPAELFAVQYPAPGAPALAERILSLLGPSNAQGATDWGFDHGAWSVLRHIYPQADIPTLQMSLDQGMDSQAHFHLAEKLKPLREEGVLVLATGNITHNLRLLDFSPGTQMPWAADFDRQIKTALEKRDLPVLFGQKGDPEIWRKAVPTPEHYWPLLYIVGLSEADETPSYPYEGLQAGSLSMRSVLYEGSRTP